MAASKRRTPIQAKPAQPKPQRSAFVGVLPDPCIEVGPYRILPRSDGMFAVHDARRPPGRMTADIAGTKEAAQRLAEEMVAGGSILPMILRCPDCDAPHIDEDAWASHPHRKHTCDRCGAIWIPNPDENTVGVAQLPDPVPTKKSDDDDRFH